MSDLKKVLGRKDFRVFQKYYFTPNSGVMQCLTIRDFTEKRISKHKLNGVKK